MERMTVGERSFRVVKLLGKGKGGYSYLVEDDSGAYVLKQLHHEPCAYYHFGDKFASEMRDYQRLKTIGIRMPKMLAVDQDQERILKEYIRGETIDRLILQDAMQENYLQQMRNMCTLLYAAHTNIDYFPTNFVVQDGLLYYIDYECNDYMPQWDFEHWGEQYWRRSEAFLQHFQPEA